MHGQPLDKPKPWLVRFFILDAEGHTEGTGVLVNNRWIMTVFHNVDEFFDDPNIVGQCLSDQEAQRLLAATAPPSGVGDWVWLPRFDYIFRGAGDIAILHLTEPHEIEGDFPRINWGAVPRAGDEIIVYGFDMEAGGRQVRVPSIFTGMGPSGSRLDQGNPLYNFETFTGLFDEGGSGTPIFLNDEIIGISNLLYRADTQTSTGARAGRRATATPLINQAMLLAWIQYYPIYVAIVIGALVVSLQWRFQGPQPPPEQITLPASTRFDGSDDQ
jgi:hypothetical protein